MDELAETVDGVSGEQGVADNIARIFDTLYNSSGSEQGMAELAEEIRGLIQTEQSMNEVNKVTPEVVKQAATTLKPHKMDVSQGFSSDTLLHAPDLLFSLTSLIFKSWLLHGTITKSVLACAFIPRVKAGKDPALSGSYRAIAGSSLLLKLFERCIVLIWGDQLHSTTFGRAASRWQWCLTAQRLLTWQGSTSCSGGY